MMQSPAKESEAPELQRGDGHYKELVPPPSVRSQQQVDPAYYGRGETRQPDLEAVGVGQIDPEVLDHGTNPSTGIAYPWSQDHAFQTQVAPVQGGEHDPVIPDQAGKQNKKKRIGGLALPTFIFIIVLALVVVGASVGGAVGGINATHNSNEAQPSAASAETSSVSDQPKAKGTATVTVTQSVNLKDYTAPTDQALYIHTDCDALQASDQQTQLANGRTDNYSVQCYKDLVRFTGGIGIDLFAVTTYSLDDCMRVCSTYNQNSNSIGCKAVSFNSYAMAAKQNNNGNCWAKNTTNGTSLDRSEWQLVATLRL